jgi:hypothetical protein
MIKIIFLDIDGVIATPKTIVDGTWGLTPSKQKLLGKILSVTDAKIVLTSSWRYNTLEITKDYMLSKGFLFNNQMIGVTIRGYQHIEKGYPMSIPRGVEIKQWIDNNICRNQGTGPYNRMMVGVDYNYVILDDDTDMLLEHAPRFLQCDGMIGLTNELANKAILILNT